ncbi:hypothetical protein [Selenomonas ruminantium]|uniref:Uncharacterized protein n=1 Tax=Selenomonas ruminantium TaxID=971 RepID=A0A1H3VPR4_SELRU|nr:hypothetical protein [Selenomonas ruminantium]SDZ76671.1 hypothetical protein SAMN05660648_00455 [Selenomonas ruminantium]
MKIDLRPVLDQEYWNEDTEQKRKDCEANLKELFAKYNVSEEDGFKVANGIVDYLEHALNDTYDTALEGGAELGEMKGYKNAVDEAEEAVARIMVSNLVKIGNGISIE